MVQGALLLWACAGICRAETAMQQSVTQRGITWFFDKEYKVGKFANGDYWVLGPVTVTRITPDFDGKNNGWEVNPVVAGGQGFQAESGFGFDASLVPALPYTTTGTASIVKTTPTGVPGQVIIKSAAVLTVVETVPPGDGALVFRPPYVGADKPLYRVADLRTDLLPSYAPVTPMPTLALVAQRFSTLQMDHKTGKIGRALRPADNMADYQPKNTPAQNEAALRLMMNDPIEQKTPALIQFVQFGIDKIHTIYLGQTWPDGGGHQPGHLIVAAFGAVLLDIQQAKDVLREARFFHGSRWFHRGKDGIVLWGGSATEAQYWNYIITGNGNRSNKDPYGYIDGGKASEGSYQLITSQSHKGEILATHLMPVLKQAWNPNEWAMMKEYTDRWVNVGKWTQPDPIAPYDGNPANYGITYGPDPKSPGMGIKGAGRFPASHGAHKDAGQYRSLYVAAMWDAYRAATPPPSGVLEVTGATVSPDWAYQNTASTTLDRHCGLLTVSVNDTWGNAAYTVTVTRTAGPGEVTVAAGSGDLQKKLVGSRRTDGATGAGTCRFSVRVVGDVGGDATAPVATTFKVRRLGDVNDDGSVNTDDSVQLTKRLNGLNVAPLATRDFDVTGDGLVTTDDDVLLAKLLNNLAIP